MVFGAARLNRARDALRSDAQIEADAHHVVDITRQISKDYGHFKTRPVAQTEAEVESRCRVLDKIVKARGDAAAYTALEKAWADVTAGKINAETFIRKVHDLYGELWSSSYMLAELISVIPHSDLRMAMLKYLLVDRKKQVARERRRLGR